MRDFRLLMISAMYENGGNTTHRLLDGHPRLMVYPFESQVGTGMSADTFSSLVPLRYRWPEFSGGMSPEEAYEAFWDEELKTLLRAPQRSKFRNCGLEMDEADRRQRFCEHLADQPVTRRNAAEAFFRSTFDAWSNRRRSGQETMAVGYNPVQVLDTEKILSDFPDSHVLHVVRNPWSGYADTRKRPFPLKLESYVWLWNICQHHALTFRRKYERNFHLLRFEDLVADPRAALKPILEKIGLGWSDACLQASFNGARLEQVHPWGTIRTPTPAANAATANELSLEEKQRIEVEAAVMLPLLGYETFAQDTFQTDHPVAELAAVVA